MRIFKNSWFARFADKEGIRDSELTEAANRLEVGQVDADLGGGVYKVRLPRPSEGKSTQTKFATAIALSYFSGVRNVLFLCMGLVRRIGQT